MTFLSHSLDTSSGNFVRGSVHLAAVRFTLSSALSNCCSPLFIYISRSVVSLVLKLRGSAVGEEVVMGDGAERERRAGLPSTRSFTFPLLNAFSFLLTDVVIKGVPVPAKSPAVRLVVDVQTAC